MSRRARSRLHRDRLRVASRRQRICRTQAELGLAGPPFSGSRGEGGRGYDVGGGGGGPGGGGGGGEVGQGHRASRNKRVKKRWVEEK
ncbi:MAG: hypothetical protein F4X43_11755, partial [Acidobacteria bacterium]|nr:hypothetical protein [Acidobacteriota bacterium]